MPPHESFTDLLPPSMNSINRKRPSAGHDSASKRYQPTAEDDSSMFITDDEELDAIANDDFAIATSDRISRPYGSTGQIRETTAQTRAPSISAARRQSQAQMNGTSPRTINGNSSSQSRSTNKANSTTPPKKKSSDAEIKEEQDNPMEANWIKGMPDADRIRVYIGKRQRITYAGRADLVKSPILTSYIIEDAETGAYIMRPQLLKTDPTDFDAVLQFIHTGDFNPVLIDKDGEKAFEKVRSDDAYGKELVRLGKVYVLAQTFQVQGLEDAIYGKICAVNARRFPDKALVELAGVIFSDKRAGVGSKARSASGSQSSGGSQDGQGQEKRKDKLEEWVISKIAGQFQEIQKYQHEEFWAVEKKTTKKMFFARLLEETADVYRANSGRPPSPAVVELLD